MVRFKILAAVAASAMIAGSAQAATPITYTGVPIQVGSEGEVGFSFTTDGTLGKITSSNINDSNGYTFGSETFLIATPSTLSYDFGGEALNGDGGIYTETAGGPNEGVFHDYFVVSATHYQAYLEEPAGLFVLARNGNVSAAPEPSTWALMVAGVGIMGATLRFNRRRENA